MSRARKEKRYSRRLAKSRIYHSPPLEDYAASRIDAQFEWITCGNVMWPFSQDGAP